MIKVLIFLESAPCNSGNYAENSVAFERCIALIAIADIVLAYKDVQKRPDFSGIVEQVPAKVGIFF
jgi:hypothetical protein